MAGRKKQSQRSMQIIHVKTLAARNQEINNWMAQTYTEVDWAEWM